MVNGVGFARKTRRSAVLMCAAVAGAAALTLTACSSSSPGSSGSAGSSGSGDIKVALILKEFTNPYWISMEKSAKAEAAIGTVPHMQIGAMLAKQWSLPLSIQQAIRHHHDKDHSQREGLTADANRNVDIIFLANLLVHALKFGHSGHTRVQGAPVDVMERLGLSPDHDLKVLLQEIKNNLIKASDFLRILGIDATGAAA